MKLKHNVRLTKEEKEIEAAFARGEYKTVPNFEKEKARYEAIARHTLAKTKTISVRMTERDLMRLKTAAAREGMPYQTLITSILHKHV
jgi:predicted DNA binding CopG/RHH family protein